VHSVVFLRVEQKQKPVRGLTTTTVVLIFSSFMIGMVIQMAKIKYF